MDDASLGSSKRNDIYQWWENQGSKELRVSIWK